MKNKRNRKNWKKIAIWPSRVLWHITDRCNLTCPYCLNSSSKISRPGLNREKLLRMIDILSNGGVTNFAMLGGEPLYHPDILEVLHYISRRRRIIELVTNGLLLNNKKIDFLKSLGHSLHYVQLSLHQKDKIDFYVELIKKLQDARIEVFTILVISKAELRKVANIYKEIAETKIPYFVVTGVGELGRAQNSYKNNLVSWPELVKLILKLKKIQRTMNYITEPKFKHRGLVSGFLNDKYNLDIISNVCKASITEFQIMANGTCKPCPFISELEAKNYTTIPLFEVKNIDDIWYSQEFNKFRNDKIFSNYSPVKQSCINCPQNISGRCSPCLINPSTCKENLKDIISVIKPNSQVSMT